MAELESSDEVRSSKFETNTEAFVLCPVSTFVIRASGFDSDFGLRHSDFISRP
jgi:hypothetical protein